MKFLEVAVGLSLRKSEIEAVTKTGDLKCKVHTKSNVYKTDLPYSTMVAMLEKEQINQDQPS